MKTTRLRHASQAWGGCWRGCGGRDWGAVRPTVHSSANGGRRAGIGSGPRPADGPLAPSGGELGGESPWGARPIETPFESAPLPGLGQRGFDRTPAATIGTLRVPAQFRRVSRGRRGGRRARLSCRCGAWSLPTSQVSWSGCLKPGGPWNRRARRRVHRLPRVGLPVAAERGAGVRGAAKATWTMRRGTVSRAMWTSR